MSSSFVYNTSYTRHRPVPIKAGHHLSTSISIHTTLPHISRVQFQFQFNSYSLHSFHQRYRLNPHHFPKKRIMKTTQYDAHAIPHMM
ncbi:hypothetical protein EYC80_002571 [Monilinia laxa]|uniref:Uncharacterized protein n=1 Tax=Monilinia laxa TaxID=61186 RepID=A0A5N6K4F0_MONLA|nr:hypothetical protein EYC80_002571 [Monilinia laxa]